MNRSIAPEFKKIQKIDLDFPQKIELANGIQLYHLRDTNNDTVKLDIVWDAGSKYQQKPLTASLTNALLLAGSKQLSAKQIAEAFDYNGGYVSHDIDKDQASITLYGLNQKIQDLFNTFQNAFSEASFPETEFNKLIEIRKNNYKVSQEKVSTLCRKAFNQHIFGPESIYGKVAEIEDFDNINQADVVNFYNQTYKQTKPVLFLVGDVNEQFISLLKEWSKQVGYQSSPLIKQHFNQTKGNIKVTKPDAIQSAIRVGKLMFTKRHPDYFKFQVLNTILGGYFGSRLMANIREDKGYTYGIGAGLSVLEDAGYFFIATEVAKDVTQNTLNEIYFELDLLKKEMVSNSELKKVQNYMLGEFLRHSDGSIAIMENFKNIYFNNLSETYYSDFINAINDVTPKQLQELAEKYFEKNTFLEVVAG
jgi:predicted Zn-dependent peptidase